MSTLCLLLELSLLLKFVWLGLFANFEFLEAEPFLALARSGSPGLFHLARCYAVRVLLNLMN